MQRFPDERCSSSTLTETCPFCQPLFTRDNKLRVTTFFPEFVGTVTPEACFTDGRQCCGPFVSFSTVLSPGWGSLQLWLLNRAYCRRAECERAAQWLSGTEGKTPVVQGCSWICFLHSFGKSASRAPTTWRNPSAFSQEHWQFIRARRTKRKRWAWFFCSVYWGAIPYRLSVFAVPVNIRLQNHYRITSKSWERAVFFVILCIYFFRKCLFYLTDCNESIAFAMGKKL